MIVFKKKDENIFECYRNNNGLLVVYGAAFWGIMLAEEEQIQIDYFCDRRADDIKYIGNIPVVNGIQLERLVRKSGKRATIIICVGLNKSLVVSVYKDLVKLPIDADVFNYFDNLNVFNENNFIFNKKEYLLYEHFFNCGYAETRMTERSVEIALAVEYLKTCQDNVVEIGAVTPYYFHDDKIIDIVDPTDEHNRVNMKASMFDYDLRQRDVLSISTVEHIGTQDYGMNEEKTVVDAIEKIINEARQYLITAPLGYNKLLDDWVKNNKGNSAVRILKRGIRNNWMEVPPQYFEECVGGIKYTPLWANGLVIIERLM